MWRRKFLESREVGEAYCRSLTQAYVDSCGTLGCRILGRHKIFSDSADATVTPCLVLDGFWEPWLTRLMLGYVKPGFTCVDVGAYVGYFTIIMAELVGAGGKVVAYEPEEDSYSYLDRNVNANGFRNRTVTSNKACGKSCGKGKLYYNRQFAGSSKLGEPMKIEDRQRDVEVDVVSLDDDVTGRIDFIKCDAEGSDADILLGAQGHFEKNPALVMVLEHQPEYADKMREALGFMRSKLKLTTWLIDDNGEVLQAEPERILSGDLQSFIVARG